MYRGSRISGGCPYFLGDALGSVRQLVDEEGTVTLAKAVDPLPNIFFSSSGGDNASQVGRLSPQQTQQIQDAVNAEGEDLYVVGGYANENPSATFKDVDYAAYEGKPYDVFLKAFGEGRLPGAAHPPFKLNPISFRPDPDLGYILFRANQTPLWVLEQ